MSFPYIYIYIYIYIYFKNNPENLPITKVDEHISSSFSMSTISSFKSIGKKLDVYRGKVP